jgi:GNAT superfamily N-acetyltransferase
MSAVVPILRVTYLELRATPALAPTLAAPRGGLQFIACERPKLAEYLALYRAVGEPLRWDQRLKMPEAELAALLQGETLDIYILRDAADRPLGFCEFDRASFPDIELKNFGLIPQAQGQGLGSWLLNVALREEWQFGPTRIWLHTDSWDHPAAIRVYERAGFRIYAVRDEPSGPL